MYHHSSEVPVNVAMAIHAVAHNKALDLVIDKIQKNSPDADLEGERAWWAREMIGH
jgi:hypothetical protein